MSDTPILDAVQQYIRSSPSRFHMPAHGGYDNISPIFSEAVKYDVTEIPGVDSLYEASGCIDASEKLAAKLFGAQKVLFSAGGSTLCIQTMLGLIAPFGGKVIFPRNLHRAALNACLLLNIEPLFILPSLSGEILSDDIGKLIAHNPGVKGVYITSPDYLGRYSDIAKIKAVCVKYGIPLVVDSAHGAHFPFLSDNLSPLALGADLCCFSAHKTLPALTPGAFLMINTLKYIKDAKRTMSLFGSTSPSYPVMIALELCCDFLKKSGISALASLTEKVFKLKAFCDLQGLQYLSGNTDPARLTLCFKQSPHSGAVFAQKLREFGCECEYADRDYAVFIFSVFHTEVDFSRLENAISFVLSTQAAEPKADLPSMDDFSLPEFSVSLRQAFFSETETVSTDICVGKIAAETACPCPPGIPIVVPGEKITKKTAFLLKGYGVYDIKVLK